MAALTESHFKGRQPHIRGCWKWFSPGYCLHRSILKTVKTKSCYNANLAISGSKWPNSQIPEYTCSTIPHNAPFRTEMCIFLFWLEHCGIWKQVHSGIWEIGLILWCHQWWQSWHHEDCVGMLPWGLPICRKMVCILKLSTSLGLCFNTQTSLYR